MKFKTLPYDITLEKLTLIEKVKWTWRIWKGYKTELKVKIKEQRLKHE